MRDFSSCGSIVIIFNKNTVVDRGTKGICRTNYGELQLILIKRYHS